MEGYTARRDLHLVIDGGKSKTEAAVISSSGEMLGKSRGPGLEIIGSVNGYEKVVKSLAMTLESLPISAKLKSVAFGLNGAQAPSDSTNLAVKAISSLISAERYIVASDVVMNYLGALGNRPGVVVAAGTGAVVLAISRDGVPYRIDGDGALIADRGSGYEIGRQGLRIAAYVDDGISGSVVLHRAMIDRFGSLEETVAAVYGATNPIQMIASFSREVAKAAEAGDKNSLYILRGAAKDLAQSAQAAARRAELDHSSFALSMAGGLINIGLLLVNPFEEFLKSMLPNARIQPALGGALEGAGIMALSERPFLEQISTWVDV
jgi:N-acetylglucosamine kinase-like BadF-type ATPase